MPRHNAPGVLENFLRTIFSACSTNVIDNVVVESQKCDLQACDDQVFVVARVRDERAIVRGSRQVFKIPAAFHFEVRAIGCVVELRIGNWSLPIKRVEIKRGGPRIRRVMRVRWHVEP
jgi:hypothetical protein